jgi:hypothetical protein
VNRAARAAAPRGAPSGYRAPVPPRLLVPTEDLFAWTLAGRGSLLATREDDPRTAVSAERFAVAHLLARHRHVMALGRPVVAHLLGALAGAGDHDPDDARGSADAPPELPADLPADAAQLHARVRRDWEATAARRAALAGPRVPDDDCDRRAVHTLLDVVPAAVLLDLLRRTAPDWPGTRQGWPGHLSWPADRTRTVPADTGDADAAGDGEGDRDDLAAPAGRFPDRPCLVRVVTPGSTPSAAQRRVVHACQEAGLEVLQLRVNSLGELPRPDDDALGVWTTPPPDCPDCAPVLDPAPPTHLLPGERPLPPFRSPGVPEELHDHHLRAHLAATTPVVDEEVAALPEEVLREEAFALLTREDAWRGARDGGRAPLRAAVRRYRALAGDPHLDHDAQRRAEAFRAALTAWRAHDGAAPSPAAPSPAAPSPAAATALREAARAAGWFLALRGVDVLAVRAAGPVVHRILRATPAGGDPDRARRLYRLLALGVGGEELQRMDAAGTYPDEATIELLAALRA